MCTVTESSYRGGTSVRSHLHLLRPAARQQHHLQVEQIACQVARGLGDVKAHSREDGEATWEDNACHRVI